MGEKKAFPPPWNAPYRILSEMAGILNRGADRLQVGSPDGASETPNRICERDQNICREEFVPSAAPAKVDPPLIPVVRQSGGGLPVSVHPKCRRLGSFVIRS